MAHTDLAEPRSGVHPRAPSLLASLRGYGGGDIAPDLIAGLTLAAIAIPEQMATARLGALSPQVGFYAFIAASIAFAIFGVSRRLSAGADSTITPIFAGSLALLAASGSPHYAVLAAGLAVLVGITVAAAGVFRMGWIGNLLSAPVTLGFLAGIAVHIVVSQLPAALGLAPLSGPTLVRIGHLAALAPHANPWAVGLTVTVLAIIVLCHKISARLPGPLAAVVLAAIGARVLALPSHGVALLGPIAGGAARLGPPMLEASDWFNLAPLALIIALVVMVQTAATTRAFPPPHGAADVDGDFIGVGLANLAAGLTGAFAVNASPPRTAIVAESGGRSQIAALAAVVAVGLLLAFGMGVLAAIPEAALAGILLFVAARIVRIGEMVKVVRAAPVEALLIAATAAAIVAWPIEQGAAAGIGLSLLHGIWGGARTRLRSMLHIRGTSVWWPKTPSRSGDQIPGVAVVAFQAPLSFLNAGQFEHDMLAVLAAPDLKLVVLEAAGLIDIDFSAAESFAAVIAAYRKAGVTLAVARLESLDAQNALGRLGLRQALGPDHIFESVALAVRALAPWARPDLGPA
jgi:MFS superfamily sulfate permease-like transporter